MSEGGGGGGGGGGGRGYKWMFVGETTLVQSALHSPHVKTNLSVHRSCTVNLIFPSDGVFPGRCVPRDQSELGGSSDVSGVAVRREWSPALSQSQTSRYGTL